MYVVHVYTFNIQTLIQFTTPFLENFVISFNLQTQLNVCSDTKNHKANNFFFLVLLLQVNIELKKYTYLEVNYLHKLLQKLDKILV